MKLSLMLLSLTFPLFMDPGFVPKKDADIKEYEKLLKMVSKAGYKAVDITNQELDFWGADRVKELLDKYDLKCSSIILFENFAALKEEIKKEVQNHSKKIIDDAVEMDCKILMVVQMGYNPGQTKKEMQKGIIDSFTLLCSYAKDKNVYICAEDFPSLDIPMCSVKDIDVLMEQVEGLRLVYDNGNMLVEGEDPMAYYERYKDRIGYYHVKEVFVVEKEQLQIFTNQGYYLGDKMYDGKYMLPTIHGKGILDIKGLLHRLKEEHYEGYISVEYSVGPLDDNNHEKNIVETKALFEMYLNEA